MIKPNQIIAARGLLRWSQDDLAEASGIHAQTIKKIEMGDTDNPRLNTINPIIDAFSRGGVLFKEGGAVLRQDFLTIIEGPDAFAKLMDMTYHILKEENIDEVLFGFSNNKASSEEVIQTQIKIRDNLNTRFRFLVENGDTFLRYPINEYRYIPEGYFHPLPYVIFGNYYALMSNNNQNVNLYKDMGLAQINRNQFEIIWSNAEKPTESTYV